MRIKIFTTGGSLDKGYSTRESAFLVMEPQAGRVLGAANVACDYLIDPLLRKDSRELTDQDRDLILRRVREEDCTRIVITHGTDTMVRTALHLAQVPDKTVVLTGAMQPAAFKTSDGPFNLGFALAAAQLLPPGVYVCMNGRIFDPRSVRKNAEVDRFEDSP